MRLTPRLPFPVLVAAGLALAGIALSPGTAAASCGSYVTIQGADQTGYPRPGPAAPCHGPGCSKAPAAPVMPMTVPVSLSSGSDQSAVDNEPTANPTYKNRWRRPHSVDHDPLRLTSSIFHPPRAF